MKRPRTSYFHFLFVLIASLIVQNCVLGPQAETESGGERSIHDLQIPEGFNFDGLKTISPIVEVRTASGDPWADIELEIVVPGTAEASERILSKGSTDQAGRFSPQLTVPVFTDKVIIRAKTPGIPDSTPLDISATETFQTPTVRIGGHPNLISAAKRQR